MHEKSPSSDQMATSSGQAALHDATSVSCDAAIKKNNKKRQTRRNEKTNGTRRLTSLTVAEKTGRFKALTHIDCSPQGDEPSVLRARMKRIKNKANGLGDALVTEV